MSQGVVVLHGTLIDGTGGDPVPDSAVVVEGGRVAAAGRAGEVPLPSGALIIEAAGKVVLPGIIEGHAHVPGSNAGNEFRSVRTLRRSLQRGITTVCSVSANLTGIALRDAIAAGTIRGCARLLAGCVVAPTNGHVRFRVADGPWEVRKAVREMVQAGADFIKTAASGGFAGQHEICSDPNYSLEELEALATEAHAWRRPVVAHCHTQPGLSYCIRAGVDQIHHGAFIDAEAVQGIKERGLFYIPTLTVTCQRNIIAKADRPWETKEMQEAQPIHRAGVRLAHEIGAKIGVGSDYPGTSATWAYGDRTMAELQELVACGLTPMDAIVAGTQTTAAAFGKLDDFGTLEPGKFADLLVVSRDPLQDVGVLYERDNINLVMKDGRIEYTDEGHKHYYRVADD